MKYLLLLCIVMVAPVTGIRAQHTEPNYNIVFIGNSITYGATLKSPSTEAPPVEVVRILREKGLNVNYANCGHSGSTTVDFLPSSKKLFPKVLAAADTLYQTNDRLIFSIMIGTNDSAIEGPTGSPVSPEKYKTNLQTIIDSLHSRYPDSHFILHRPVWYSPNTHNRSLYLEEGLKRLQTYTPVLDELVKENPYVSKGDRSAYNFFRKHPEKYFTAENGNSGLFYLHPNARGAKELGHLWANSIMKHISKSPNN